MDETDVYYYFEDPEACKCPEAFKEIEHAWQALEKKNSLEFKTQISGNIDKTVVLKGDVGIGKNTIIDPYVVIEGPAIIGDGCHIRSHCLIRPGTIIGNNAVIGHGSEIKNCIVFDEAKIASHVFAGDSIIGKSARLGSGVSLGNRRFDQEVIEIKIKNERFSTGSDKFGAIIGDQSRLGANITVSPGTLIGKHCWISGNVKGFIPKDSFVKVKQKIEISKKERVDLKRKDMKGNI